MKISAMMNMAIDEAIGDEVAAGSSPPTIRFYGWMPNAVSIGRFQSIEDEVDVERCRAWGIDVVRRRTGGGAVFHNGEGEVTYSVICPEPEIGTDIAASYRTICGWVMEALNDLNIRSSFRPVNDIVVDGRKISGSAQTRRNGVILQHGTVLYSLNPDLMFGSLKIRKEKLADKGIQRPQQGITCVKEISNASMDDLKNALVTAFGKGKDIISAPMTKEETDRSLDLVSTRYSQDDWNRSR